MKNSCAHTNEHSHKKMTDFEIHQKSKQVFNNNKMTRIKKQTTTTTN